MSEAKVQQLNAPLQLQEKVRPHRTLMQDAMRRFFRNRLAVFGFTVVIIFLVMAIGANVIAPYDYDDVDFTKVLLFPLEDPAHFLGTDELGRDLLSRLIFGARTSMVVGLSVMTIAVVIGVTMGGFAGYFGGNVDFFVSRIIDIMTAFPGLLFAILLVTVAGGGVRNIILALSITSWLGIARLTRGQILSLREKEFVEAARSLGVRGHNIIYNHLVPNALSPILVAVSFGIPAAIFGEAGLSFLGIGVNDPIASWGKMVGSSQAYISVYWHLGLFPTLMIALSMLGFSFMGDGLRDALDPKMLK